MLKKGISISLSLLLAALVFVNPLLFSAQAEAPLKLTQNFESSFSVSGCEIVSDFGYNSNGSLHFKNNVQNQWSKLFYGTGFGGDATGLYIQQGKTYTVKFQMYIKALQSSGNSAVVLQYLTTNNSGWNNDSNVTINKDKGAIDENASFSILPTSTTGTWFTVTRSFKADRNAYLGLYCYNTASAGNSYADVYIDDVQLEQQAQTTIHFNTNGGNELADLCGNAGTTIGTLPTPVKEGFTFGGWFLDSALTQLFEQQNYPEQDITLYAKWENTGIYTQDFESTLSVGSGAELSTAQAVSGSYSLHFKKDCPKPGNSFVAVFGNSGATQNLQAGKSYQLTYQVYVESYLDGKVPVLNIQCFPQNLSAWNAGNKTLAQKNLTTVEKGKWVTVTQSLTPAANGYLGFWMMNTKGDEYSEYASVFVDDVVLSEVNDVTITFNSNGGSSATPLVGRPNTEIGNLPQPTRAGYLFGGWYTEAACSTPFTNTVFPSANITLYAKWVLDLTAGLVQDFETPYAVSDCEITNLKPRTGNNSLHFKSDAPKPGNAFARLFGDANTAMYIQKGHAYKFTYYVFVESYLSGKTPVLYTQYFAQNQSAWSANNKVVQTLNLTTIAKGEWVEITQFINATQDAYLGFWMMNTDGPNYSEYASVFVDDAALIEVPTVTVRFHTNGGNAVQPISGASGSAIALPSAEKQGSTFAGWYIDSVCKTPFTSAVFPEQNITLYAKWYEKGVWQQDFETYQSGSGGGKVYTTGGATRYQKTGPNDTNVHGGEGSLYVPPGNNSFFAMLFPYGEKLEKGRHYKIELWYKVYAMTNSGQIRLTYLSNRDNCTTWGENGVNRYMDLVDINSKTINEQMGVWRKQTVYFTAAYDAYAGLYTWGPIGFYLDDVTITETLGVTVRFETNGGKALEPVSGAIGESITTRIPTPQRADRSFGGWYLDSALTQPFLETTFTKNMTLYAKWLPAGTWYQDYEAYVATGNMTTTNFEVYKKQNNNDTNVHGGNYSMHRKIQDSNFSVLFPYGSKTTAGDMYRIEFWLKLNQFVTNGEIRLTFLEDSKSSTSWTDERRATIIYSFAASNQESIQIGSWKKVSMVLPIDYDCYLGLYCWGGMDFYIDDVTVTRLQPGLLESNIDHTYAQTLHNEVLHTTQPITALTQKTSQKQVIPFNLLGSGDYALSATVNDATGGSYVALAWDKDGNNLLAGTKITAGERQANRVLLDKSGLIYLVIYNGAGANAFSDVTLAKYEAMQLDKSLTGFLNQPNYASADDAPELTSILAKIKASSSYFSQQETADADGETPATGDVGVSTVAVILLMLASAALLVLKFRKAGAAHELF